MEAEPIDLGGGDRDPLAGLDRSTARTGQHAAVRHHSSILLGALVGGFVAAGGALPAG